MAGVLRHREMVPRKGAVIRADHGARTASSCGNKAPAPASALVMKEEFLNVSFAASCCKRVILHGTCSTTPHSTRHVKTTHFITRQDGIREIQAKFCGSKEERVLILLPLTNVG